MDSATVASAGPLPGLHRQAVRLEQFSIAWMLIEAAWLSPRASSPARWP